MGVNLQIVGNHNLKMNTYESGVKEIEQALNIKITKLNIDEQAPEETDDFEKISFQSFYSFYDGKIDEKSIWLKMNYDQCEILRVFKNGFDIFLINKMNTRFHVWKKLVSKDFLNNDEDMNYINKWKSQYSDWIKLKEFAAYILRKFGGNKLVYTNDSNFQNFGPELQFGMAFEDAININTKVSPPLDYKSLIEHGDKNTDLNDWYIEQFDFGNLN